MRSFGFRIVAVVALVLGFGAVALAGDRWQVVRPVRLLTKPSASGQRIKTLHPPDLVTATGANPSGDYLRVQDGDGNVGWVYEPYLAEAAESDEEDAASVEPMGPSNAISTSWEKPAPQAKTFRLHGRSCGPAGDGDETETNRRKNRIDVPSSYHAITFDAVDKLAYPNATTARSRWTAEQLAEIAPYEGVALTVTGYMVALRPQRGNAEACNCSWTGDDETDWHIALVGSPGGKEADALVVETTPRIRIDHPRWTTENIRPWLNSSNPIRVSGWLLMDPWHKNHLGRYRNTLWEVHPITKIEVMVDGMWVDLDHLTPGPS